MFYLINHERGPRTRSDSSASTTRTNSVPPASKAGTSHPQRNRSDNLKPIKTCRVFSILLNAHPIRGSLLPALSLIFRVSLYLSGCMLYYQLSPLPPHPPIKNNIWTYICSVGLRRPITVSYSLTPVLSAVNCTTHPIS